jgi:hypothetical protein
MTKQRGGGVVGGAGGGFKGWKLKCLGSFSKIVKVDEETGKEGESYELYVIFSGSVILRSFD